jgi:uncharacterized glyoxalase superfamily protein PhnB
MQLNTYLNYGGNCRQAFEFYEKHLGGKITMMTTHAEVPDPSNVPPEWRDAVLHARIELGGTTVFAADVPPDRFQPMRSAYLSLSVDSDAVPRSVRMPSCSKWSRMKGACASAMTTRSGFSTTSRSRLGALQPPTRGSDFTAGGYVQ